MTNMLNIKLSRSDVRLLAICLGASLVVFLIDLQLPLGVAAAVPYVLIVAITVWGQSPRLEFVIAILASFLTVLGYYMSPDGGEMWYVLTNRGLALLLIWGGAWLIHTRRVFIANMLGANVELDALRSNLEVQVAQRTFELSEREALLEDVLDTTDMAFLLVSPLGNILMSNKAACDLFDCSKNALSGWNVKSMFRVGQEAELDYLLSGHDRSEPRFVPALATSDKRGSKRTVSVKATPSKGHTSDAVLLSISLVDE